MFLKTRAAIQHFSAMGFVDSTRFVRSINKVFISISGFYSNDGQQKLVQRMMNDSLVWRSVAEWVLSTEDFLFYMVGVRQKITRVFFFSFLTCEGRK